MALITEQSIYTSDLLRELEAIHAELVQLAPVPPVPSVEDLHKESEELRSFRLEQSKKILAWQRRAEAIVLTALPPDVKELWNGVSDISFALMAGKKV